MGPCPGKCPCCQQLTLLPVWVDFFHVYRRYTLVNLHLFCFSESDFVTWTWSKNPEWQKENVFPSLYCIENIYQLDVWYTPIILQRLRQEGPKFKVRLGNSTRSCLEVIWKKWPCWAWEEYNKRPICSSHKPCKPCRAQEEKSQFARPVGRSLHGESRRPHHLLP